MELKFIKKMARKKKGEEWICTDFLIFSSIVSMMDILLKIFHCPSPLTPNYHRLRIFQNTVCNRFVTNKEDAFFLILCIFLSKNKLLFHNLTLSTGYYHLDVTEKKPNLLRDT